MLCPMCQKLIVGEASDILPGKALCMDCATNIRTFAKGKTDSERHAAFAYIQQCKSITQDAMVLSAINSLEKQFEEKPKAKESPIPQSQHSRMFDNVGQKIMSAAEIFCWLGIAVSVICGVILLMTGFDSRNGEVLVFAGIAVAIIGSIVSWLGSLIAYGFGEMVNNSRIQTEIALKKESKN